MKLDKKGEETSGIVPSFCSGIRYRSGKQVASRAETWQFISKFGFDNHLSEPYITLL